MSYAKKVLNQADKAFNEADQTELKSIDTEGVLTDLGLRQNSEWHYQVPAKDGRMHDIWVNKDGILKLKLVADSRAYEMGSLREIRHRIIHSDNYVLVPEKKWIPEQQTAALSVRKSRNAKEQLWIQGEMVYCDWSSEGRIAVVYRNKDEITIHVRNGTSEMEAIRWAASLYPQYRIFCDSQSHVCAAHQEGIDVHWIPRKENRVADHASRYK